MNAKSNQKTSLALALSATITIAVMLGTTTVAHAQFTRFAASGVSAGSLGSVNTLDYQYDGSLTNAVSTSASANHTFIGLDSNENTQSMIFTGSANAQSDFTGLHVFATAAATNTYYNPLNQLFESSPEGSPSILQSSNLSGFENTFQFGGTALQAGYKAKYIFHVDGTNSGDWDQTAQLDIYDESSVLLSHFVTIGNNAVVNTDWVTQEFTINGITPQYLNIKLRNHVILDVTALPELGSYSGTSNFSSTVTLAGIEVRDPSGNLASGWTVTSGSGTVYNAIQGTSAPEPTTLGLFVLGSLGILVRRRKVKYFFGINDN
jgi:PEP-CTERM motif